MCVCVCCKCRPQNSRTINIKGRCKCQRNTKLETVQMMIVKPWRLCIKLSAEILIFRNTVHHKNINLSHEKYPPSHENHIMDIMTTDHD